MIYVTLMFDPIVCVCVWCSVTWVMLMVIQKTCSLYMKCIAFLFERIVRVLFVHRVVECL